MEKQFRKDLETFTLESISEKELVLKPGSVNLIGPIAIQVLKYGNVVVYGDYEPVIFGGGRVETIKDALSWIGKCKSVSYPHEKARIGMGFELLDYDPDQAVIDINDSDLDLEDKKFILSLVDGEHELKEALCELGFDEYFDVGRVVDNRVILAWLAMARGLELIEGLKEKVCIICGKPAKNLPGVWYSENLLENVLCSDCSGKAKEDACETHVEVNYVYGCRSVLSEAEQQEILKRVHGIEI